MATAPPTARAFCPEFKHTDRERWICVYPAYINSKKSIAEGRKVPKNKAIDNPTFAEIRDVCASAGMTLGVENKVYPREMDAKDMKARGRIRVQLRKEDGTPLLDQYPTRKSVLYYIGETIPKLKSRMQSSGGSQSSSKQEQQSGGGGGKKAKGKGKRR